MTTSGDTSYSVTTQSIIRGALLDVRAVAPGQTVSAGDFQDCLDLLNQMILAWQAKGVGLWLNTAYTLSLVANTASYLLGPGATIPTTRPLGVVEARLYQSTSGTETPMERMAREDYMSLPLKSSTGLPNQYYFDPQLTNAVLYIWPVAQTGTTDTIKMTLKAPIQDFVSVGDNPQFPREWFLALRTNLAVWISPMYQVPLQDFQRLTALAKEAFDMANDFDREDAPTQFVPYNEPGRMW